MKKNDLKRILALLLTATLAMAAAGCAGASAGSESKNASAQDATKKEEKVTSNLEVAEDGSCLATFDKADAGIGHGSGITIEAGKSLVIDNDLTEGAVRFTLSRGGSDIDEPPIQEDEDAPALIDTLLEDPGSTEYTEIEPGNYMLFLSVEKKASGTIRFSQKDLNDDKTASDPANTAATGSSTADTAAPAAKAPETSPEMYFGSWVTGDYLLNIGESEDGLYATVYHQPAGGPTTEWLYNEVSFDPVADELNTFETGIKTVYAFDAEGIIDTVEEEFDDGAAAFRLTKDGKLIWVDYKETPGKNEITLDKSAEPIEAPALLE